MMTHFKVTQSVSRREFIKTAGGIGAATLMAPAFARGAENKTSVPQSHPNLVFVFSDQHSFDMLGCAGNRDIITPNLDRFAGEGIRFTDSHTSCPVCTPYRSMLLSGMHPLHNGAFANDITMIPGKGEYFGEVLRDAGYRTAYIGKWHLLGGDRRRPVPRGELRYGFDEVFLTDNCTTEYRPGLSYFWNDRDEKEIFNEWQPYGQTRQAIEFLDKQTPDRPFALFVSWHPPHDHGKQGLYYLYNTLPELEAMYAERDVTLRPTVPDRSERRKQQLRDYMAQVSGIDIAFGRLIDKLRTKGFDKNTIVVFTADHGDLLGAYGWNYPKDCPQDYSDRVPLLLRFPGGLKGGKLSDLLVGTLDLMPTILALMGLNVPESCQGRNLADAIRKGDDNAVESIPTMMLHGGILQWRGVVTRDYVFAYQRNGFTKHAMMNVLYDRKNDPLQQHNRFKDPEYAAAKKRMLELTRDWMKRFGDPFIAHEQLNGAGIQWRYQTGGPINRVSPVEWTRKQGHGDPYTWTP